MKEIRITKTGWIFILLTILLGFAAVNTGNNLVYLIASGFLSFMAVSGLLGKGNISKIDIVIDLPQEIYAEKDAFIKIRLKNNKKLFPAFLIRVSFDNKSVLFPFVDPKGEDIGNISTIFNKRGFYSISNIHISSVFPFNFFVRCRKIETPCEFIVFPMPKKCNIRHFFINTRSTGELTTDKKGFEPEILSIRNYIKTDPFKYISWKASAKTGELKTKELSAHLSEPIIIDLDEIEINGLEEKISCITYILIKNIKQNIPIGIKIKKKLYKPDVTKQHRINMLKELALYNG